MTLEEIVEAFARHPGDIYMASRSLGVPPTVLMNRIRQLEERPEKGSYYIIQTYPAPRDVGRLSLRRHIVSVRRRGDPGWPLQDKQALEKARRDYDAGLVDMFQGHEGRWVIQYAKRRKKPDANRRPYFSVGLI